MPPIAGYRARLDGEHRVRPSAWMCRCLSLRTTSPPSARRWARFGRRGFRTVSKRNWARGGDVEGWVVVGWQGDKWNTKAQAEASLSVAVWPPGTREHLEELRGTEVEPFMAANAPVLGTARQVTRDPAADTYTVVADMSDNELAVQVERAKAFAEAMVAWAETMLDARVSATLMRDNYAVAALLARDPDWPGLDSTLDRLTAAPPFPARAVGIERGHGYSGQDQGL